MNQEDFKELLRGKGLKVTSQRLLSTKKKRISAVSPGAEMHCRILLL